MTINLTLRCVYIILFSIIAASTVAYTQQIHLTSVLDGSKGEISVGDSTEVTDTLYYSAAYDDKLIKPYYVRNIITLRVNEDAVKYIGKFSDTLYIRFIYKAENGVLDSSNANLVLNYNPDSIYIARAAIVFNDAHFVKVRILNSVPLPDTSVHKLLILENEMIPYRQFKFDCDVNAPSLTILNTTADELTVGWTNVIGTDEADLEWTFIDSGAIASYKRDDNTWDAVHIFENNATRITLAGYSYNIPLLFSGSGSLFVRIRAVQYRGIQRITGKWGADVTKEILKYDITDGHEKNINWQSSISFAEEGKRKAVVQYYDGSLRERQTVTKDNINNITIVAETMYNYQGRAVIQVMPAPTLNTIIQYSRNLNVGLNRAEYDKTRYDLLSSSIGFCDQHAQEMDSTSGASYYYSSNIQPQLNGRYDKYIPDAYNYPFTETEYTADNTGRIKRQSGVGPSFILGSGHETKYYYAITPDQNELDALFGTEAGDRNHYFKNAIQDANGQISVSYTDMHGRTIATALSGDSSNSPSMVPLNSNLLSAITETIADAFTNVTKGVLMESHKSLLVTKTSSHTFHYTLNPQTLSLNNCKDSAICYDCLYDLHITITDDCNNHNLPGDTPYVVAIRNFRLDSITNNCNSGIVDTSFSLLLSIGNYEITKTLSLSHAAQDYYKDSIFILNNTCKTFTDFINEQRALLPQTVDCGITCASCLASIGSYTNFKNNYILNVLGAGGQDSTAYITEIHRVYVDAIAACNQYCDIETINSNSIRDAMLLDVTPESGQYAEPANIDQYSIFSTDNYGQQLYQSLYGYKDEQGKSDTIFNYYNNTYKLPQQLLQQEFISNFKPSWAQTLITLHPEFCKLTDYENNLNSYNWDTRARSVKTYSEAIMQGYADPFSNPQQDPLVSNGIYYASLYDAYNHYTDVTIKVNGNPVTYPLSMWDFVKLQVLCPSNDSSCTAGFLYSNHHILYCAGDSNMAWNNFIELYIRKKTELLNAHYYGLSCPATAPNLADAGHRLNFTTYSFASGNTVLDGYNSTDTNYLKSKAQSDMQAVYQNTCNTYKSVWTKQLLPGYKPADINILLPQLAAVCIMGSDQDHPLGSRDMSTDSPGVTDGTHLYKSFDDVIDTYNQEHGYTKNLKHNADILTMPLPYYSNIAYNKLIKSKPGAAECGKINGYYQQYEIYKLSPTETFSQYLERTTGTKISDTDLDILLNSCAAGSTCHFLSEPVILPPIFQENTGSPCVGCAETDSLYQLYRSSYPDSSYEPKITTQDDSVQAKINDLFADFMNNRLGFNLIAADYLAFMASCPPDSIQSVNNFDSSHFILDAPYFIAAGDYKLVFSNGVAHIPLSIEKPFSHNNWEAESKFSKIDTLCTGNQFTFETRVKESQSDRGVPLYDLLIGFTSDSVNFQLNFIQPVDSLPNFSPLDYAGYILSDRDTVYQKYNDPVFARKMTDWTKVTIQAINNIFRIYVNDTLIETVPYMGTINQITRMYNTYKGTDGFADYFKVYDQYNVLQYSEEFEDSYQSPSNYPAAFACPESLGNKLCRKQTAMYPDITPDTINNCTDSTYFITSTGTERYSYYKDSLNNIFDSMYHQKCLQAYKYENLTVSHTVAEYNYTLYYYDQPGNLVQTIPPTAVKPNWNANYLALVKAKRTVGDTLRPGHNLALATRYLYNTLNQVVLQKTPDAGNSSFFYDRLGRLVLSRNSKQAPSSKYSYTFYDGTGRITEVGELTNSSTMTNAISKVDSKLSAWLNNASDSRTQITQTVYDLPYWPFTSPVDSPLMQHNLRNRVSFTKVFNTADYLHNVNHTSATYYSYDVHGNVDTLVQDYKLGSMQSTNNQYKKIVYTYDLVSGKVNAVTYQANTPDPLDFYNTDAFYQRYSYDAENRLINVETSTDSMYWENEAFYSYHRHGPLAREVIGQQKVQGIDYAYTLQGWLKGVNSTIPSSPYDMGIDGQPAVSSNNVSVARDVFGFALYYYGQNDYHAADITAQPFADTGTPLGNNFKPLYNGNIAAITEAITSFSKPLTFNFRYDQLNRLVQMCTYRNANTVVNNVFQPIAINDYNEDIQYDANGNILKYNRYGNSTNINFTNAKMMDNLTYNYNSNTNQLNNIKDNVGNTVFNADIDKQPKNNYRYDATGNLISDSAEGINNIEWNVYGKIKTITKRDGTVINYTYDATGNRINKIVTGAATGNGETWYVRDAAGNIMTVYTINNNEVNNGNPTISEVNIYSSRRIGICRRDYDMYIGGPDIKFLGQIGDVAYYNNFERGRKLFELTNHLGNVLATVTDNKIPVASGTAVNYYTAKLFSANEYYPFGMIMPGRSYTASSSDSYRYGFQKQEIEKEIWGGAYSYKYRLEDPRSGRFFSVDPLFKKYPFNSPYAFAENKVGMGIELEGTELLPLNSGMFNMNYEGDNKAPCLACRVPSNGKYSVSLNRTNVPKSFKDNAGNPLFTPASVNVGPNGYLIPDKPYATISQALPGNKLPASPEWTMGGGLSFPNSLYRHSRGINYYSVSSGTGYIPYSGANTLNTFNGVTSGLQEGFKYVQLYGHDVPIWNAYKNLSDDKATFFAAQNLANAYINANKNDAFLNQPQVRADMTNFIYNGSVRPLLEPGSNYFDRLNYNLQLMNYGINFLKNNNKLRNETLNKYNNLFQLNKK